MSWSLVMLVGVSSLVLLREREGFSSIDASRSLSFEFKIGSFSANSMLGGIISRASSDWRERSVISSVPPVEGVFGNFRIRITSDSKIKAVMIPQSR